MKYRQTGEAYSMQASKLYTWNRTAGHSVNWERAVAVKFSNSNSTGIRQLIVQIIDSNAVYGSVFDV
jgi:hypothetical protein